MGFDRYDEEEGQTPEAAAPLLEIATKLSGHQEGDPGWYLTVVPDAGEAGGSFFSGRSRRPKESSSDAGGGGLLLEATADPERSMVEANRRARSKVRRYCAANRLNRMGTLTYAGDGNHDPDLLRAHVAEFWIGMRQCLGGKPFPYLWVPEWHPGGHGLHVHFAVGRYIKHQLISDVWGRGWVHIKRHDGLPIGSTALDEARIAAGYIGKYIGKGFEDEDARAPGRHRYEVAQGFQPRTVRVWGGSLGSALAKAEYVVGRPARIVWRSSDEANWDGPPVVWAQY